MEIPLDTLLSILAPAIVVVVWLVRLESRTQSNTRGVERSDSHINEGTNIKLDIGTLKSDVKNIKENISEIKEVLKTRP